jgi:hypothetical protein
MGQRYKKSEKSRVWEKSTVQYWTDCVTVCAIKSTSRNAPWLGKTIGKSNANNKTGLIDCQSDPQIKYNGLFSYLHATCSSLANYQTVQSPATGKNYHTFAYSHHSSNKYRFNDKWLTSTTKLERAQRVFVHVARHNFKEGMVRSQFDCMCIYLSMSTSTSIISHIVRRLLVSSSIHQDLHSCGVTVTFLWGNYERCAAKLYIFNNIYRIIEREQPCKMKEGKMNWVSEDGTRREVKKMASEKYLYCMCHCVCVWDEAHSTAQLRQGTDFSTLWLYRIMGK